MTQDTLPGWFCNCVVPRNIYNHPKMVIGNSKGGGGGGGRRAGRWGSTAKIFKGK